MTDDVSWPSSTHLPPLSPTHAITTPLNLAGTTGGAISGIGCLCQAVVALLGGRVIRVVGHAARVLLGLAAHGLGDAVADVFGVGVAGQADTVNLVLVGLILNM